MSERWWITHVSQSRRRNPVLMGSVTPPEAALAFVNEIRRDLGLKPRKALAKGERENWRCCPIANSIPRPVVAGWSWVVLGLERRWRTPAPAARFIVAFDDGEYPEYEAKP